MDLTLTIPDDLANRMASGGAAHAELERRALEAMAADEYRNGRQTAPELQRLLGIETSFQLDGFLKAHDIRIEYTMADLERERAAFASLGL